jgi:hypothetical protein
MGHCPPLGFKQATDLLGASGERVLMSQASTPREQARTHLDPDLDQVIPANYQPPKSHVQRKQHNGRQQ